MSELQDALKSNKDLSEGTLRQSALGDSARNQAQTKRQLEETTRRLEELKEQQAQYKAEKERAQKAVGEQEEW